jgi:hypothetical protein
MVFVHPGIVPEVAARPTWLKRVVTVRSAPRELADEAQSVLLLNLVQARSGPRRVSLRANKVVVVSVKGAESFRIHLGLLLAELICIPAFVIEVSRALGGNTLSWAYVFEWPVLGVYAVYMWRKMLREVRAEREDAPSPVLPLQPDDPKLEAWNAYLAKLHESEQVKGSKGVND